MIHGTDAGTLELAQPPEGAVRRAVVGGVTIPYAGPAVYGEMVWLSSTDVTIPGAGGSLVTSAEVVDRQSGMGSVGIAGDPIVLERPAVVVVYVEVRSTDGAILAGSVVDVTINGDPTAAWPTPQGPWSRWSDSTVVVAYAGDTIDITLTPGDGAPHDFSAIVRVAAVEPPRVAESSAIGSALMLYGSSDDDAVVIAIDGSTFPAFFPPNPADVVTAGCATRVGDDTWYFAASNDGRIWRSQGLPTTAATDWVQVHDFTATGNTITCMATDGAGRIRALNPLSGVTIGTDDNGDTWSAPVAIPTSYDQIRHIKGHWYRWDSYVSSSSTKTMQVSSDGDTWSAEITPVAGLALDGIVVAIRGDGAGIALGNSGPKMATTSDYGATWSAVTPSGFGNDYVMRAHRTITDELLVYRQGGAVWRWTGGGTFTQVHTFPGVSHVAAIDHVYAHGSTGFSIMPRSDGESIAILRTGLTGDWSNIFSVADLTGDGTPSFDSIISHDPTAMV